MQRTCRDGRSVPNAASCGNRRRHYDHNKAATQTRGALGAGRDGAMDLLRFFFSYFGRATRAKFWIGIGVAFAMIAVAKPLHQFAASTIVPGSETLFHLSALVLSLWGVGWLVSMFAIAVKRLHDLGRSGWWVLLLAVPFVG